jgi:hypothetical protein
MKIRIRLSSILDMLDSFLGEFEFPESGRDEVLHLLSAAEDCDGLLVLVRVNLNLVDQLFVYHLEFRNYCQQPIELPVEPLVVIQAEEMLLAQSLLLCHDEVQLVLLCAHVGLSGCQFGLQLLASSDLVAEIGRVASSFSLVLFGLPEDVVVGEFGLIDLVLDAAQLVLSPLGVLVLLLELSDELLVVVLSLVQSLIQLGIDGLAVPHSPLQVLQLLDVAVE